MLFERSVRSKMFFRFVVTSLVVLPCAMSAVMGQTNLGRTGVSQARDTMAVFIEYDGKDRFSRLEATFVFELVLFMMAVPVFGRHDLAEASSQSGRAVTDFLQAGNDPADQV